MTYEEIVQGFEYCVSVNSCDDCKKPTPRFCTTFETKDFLEFINRQQAEIERLKESRDRWKRNALAFDEASRITEKEIEALQEEIERLRNG